MDTRGKRMLVIGGAGLIGSHTYKDKKKVPVPFICRFGSLYKPVNSLIPGNEVDSLPAGGPITVVLSTNFHSRSE